MKPRVGLIPGIIREELKQDLFGTFETLAGLGYQGIEGSAVLQGDVAENRRRREDLGLKAISVGVSLKDLGEGLDRVIEGATAAGADHVVLFWAPCESKDALLADAELYNRAGERCRAAGLKFCYHNHDHELKTTFDGQRGLEVLMANTDPAKVFFELDVGWVIYGGLDPAATLRRHAARVPLIHLKDVADPDERGVFTAVGTGVLDVKGVIQAADAIGAGWCVVEQDRPHNLTPLESVTASILNIRELWPAEDRAGTDPAAGAGTRESTGPS